MSKVIISDIQNNEISEIIKNVFEIFRVEEKVKNKKVYSNFHKHFGTLTIRIKKSSSVFYKIQGHIDSFSFNGRKQTGV